MRSVARRRQTGALLVDNTVNEEMQKGPCDFAENGFQSDTRFSFVAGATGIMPQHDYGLEGGFQRATGHRSFRPSVWCLFRALVDGVRAESVHTLRSMRRLLLFWRAEVEEGKMLVTSTLVGRTVPGWPQLRWTREGDAEEK